MEKITILQAFAEIQTYAPETVIGLPRTEEETTKGSGLSENSFDIVTTEFVVPSYAEKNITLDYVEYYLRNKRGTLFQRVTIPLSKCTKTPPTSKVDILAICSMSEKVILNYLDTYGDEVNVERKYIE